MGHFPLGLACGWLPHQVGRKGGSAFLLFTPLLSTLHLHFHVLATETVDGYRAFVFGQCLCRVAGGEPKDHISLVQCLSSSPSHPQSPTQRRCSVESWGVNEWTCCLNRYMALLDLNWEQRKLSCAQILRVIRIFRRGSKRKKGLLGSELLGYWFETQETLEMQGI